MFDQFHIPNKYLHNVQIFNPTGSTNLAGMQSWQKPKGISMVLMIAVSGGGGGGGGSQAAAGALKNGGGGGACSGVAKFICPAFVLPDKLYIQVGQGGIGGNKGTNGSAGTNSLVLSSKTNALPNIILASGVNAPGGGATAGTGGSVPTIAVTQPIHTLGLWSASVGLVGAAGGSGAAGTSVTAWAALPFSPGAGGGGVSITPADFAGGAQTATALFDYENQGYYNTTIANGGTAGGGNGDSGSRKMTPFFNSGGAGGGGKDTGFGGDGGAGGIGCGGGGGGGGLTSSGGRGGNGGPGIVIIVSW